MNSVLDEETAADACVEERVDVVVLGALVGQGRLLVRVDCLRHCEGLLSLLQVLLSTLRGHPWLLLRYLKFVLVHLR